MLRFFTLGQLSAEHRLMLVAGDLAFCAQFLAVGPRSICHQLRKAGHHSVWAPACQDRIAGGHAGVGVVSLGGAPLSLPSFCHSSVSGVFQVGSGLENHSSYCSRRSGSSFCCFWLSGGGGGC